MVTQHGVQVDHKHILSAKSQTAWENIVYFETI